MVRNIAYFAHSKTFFTNNTVIVFFNELAKKGIHVFLFCPAGTRLPASVNNVTLHTIPNQLTSLPRNPLNILKAGIEYLKALQVLRRNKIDIAIGQDHLGLIIAGRLNILTRFRQFHYFSFEIYLFDECISKIDKKVKQLEVKYCSKATDILIQDEKRKHILEKENGIKRGINWHLIPVANDPASAPMLKKKSVATEKTVLKLIHSGSVESWTGMDIIISGIKQKKPENCWYYIHSYEPFHDSHPVHRELIELSRNKYPVSLIHTRFDNEDEYYAFLQDFDVGLALYVAQPKLGHTLNIGEIGLASGKFSNFILLNMPVITTANSYYPRFLKTYHYGWIIHSDLAEIENIHKYSRIAGSQNLKLLYQNELNPVPAIKTLVDRIHHD